MYRQTLRLLPIVLLSALLLGCGGDDGDEPTLSLLGTTANGIPLVDGTINVEPEATFQLTFSAALSPSAFESAFSLTAATGASPDLSFAYSNASSRAVVTATLDTEQTYTLSIPATGIGQNGAKLDRAVSLTFTTADGGVITELAPCTSATDDCLRTISLSEGDFTYFASHPIGRENARWERLTAAVIVVHGQNRNHDDYFSYMTATLRNLGAEEETALIAPYFKDSDDAQANELYWSTSAWREGATSSGGTSVSSFAVIDEIVDLLGDQSRFPVLEKIIVTGHSSGGLFTHVYAAASGAEEANSRLDFRYCVANSQYFYYPLDVRYVEATGQFTEPTGCPTFNHWPYGYVNTPSYLSGVSEQTVDERIVQRNVTYLLGTDDVATSGTLNTDDCEAVLLGEHRFARGENIVSLMESEFAATNQSTKVLVPGVGHNAQQMYGSTAFGDWLQAEL